MVRQHDCGGGAARLQKATCTSGVSDSAASAANTSAANTCALLLLHGLAGLQQRFAAQRAPQQRAAAMEPNEAMPRPATHAAGVLQRARPCVCGHVQLRFFTARRQRRAIELLGCAWLAGRLTLEMAACCPGRPHCARAFDRVCGIWRSQSPSARVVAWACKLTAARQSTTPNRSLVR